MRQAEDKRHVDSLTDIRTETKEKETRHTERQVKRQTVRQTDTKTLNRYNPPAPVL